MISILYFGVDELLLLADVFAALHTAAAEYNHRESIV